MEASMDPVNFGEQHVLFKLKGLQSLNQLPDHLREEIEKALKDFHEDDDNLSLSKQTNLDTEPEGDAGSDLELIISRGKTRGYFLVRNQDLELFDSICSGLQAAAGAGFFLLDSSLSSSAIAAITAVVISIFKLLRRLAQKGTIVTPPQLQVMLALKINEKMSISKLTSWLKKTKVLDKDEMKWEKGKVTKILNELKRVHLADGTIISLVDQAPDGKWEICGSY